MPSTMLTLGVQNELGFRSGGAATGIDHSLNLVARDGTCDPETERYTKRRKMATRRAHSQETTSSDDLLSETPQYNDVPKPLETSDAARAATSNDRSKPNIEVRVPGLLFPKSSYIGYTSPLPPVAESQALRELLVCKRSCLKLRY